MLKGRRDEGLSISRLREEMDRLFTDLVGEARSRVPFPWGSGRTFPALNLWEDDDNLYAEAEVPGVPMEELEVTVVGHELTIKGERKDAAQAEVSYHRRERGVGVFNRVVRLPTDVDADKVSATLREGVLTLTLPKAEAGKPRKIPVKGSG